MAQRSSTPPAGDGIKPEDRFRYIGFGVFPSKPGSFWRSDAEAQQYAAKIRTDIGDSLLHRDFSLLETETMSLTDRWIVTLSAAFMFLTVAMPWVSYRTGTGTDFSLAWPSTLSILLGNLGTAFASGVGVGLSAILSLIVMVAAPILGVWTIAMVWRRAKSKDLYYNGLRLPLKLSYITVYSALGVMVLSFLGGHIPGFESWGLIDPPERYGAGVLFGILSFGPYIALGMALICAVKAGDL